MLRIDRSGKKLVRLQKSALAEADHWERELQAMIIAAPDSFCEEIGESLWLIGQEVRPSEAVPDRIDILAVDEAANSVIIELKRGTHKLQLLQAVSYAGMVSRWSPDRFVETLAANFSTSNDDARSEIEEHTGSEVSSINQAQAQRIILIAEDFDPALLVAAEWLHESFGVDIRCYRIQLSREENGDDYLTCTCIYPPIEIATLTRGSDSRPGRTATAWGSWNVVVESIENTALKDFVGAELARKQEERLTDRQIIYRIDGQRRFCPRHCCYRQAMRSHLSRSGGTVAMTLVRTGSGLASAQRRSAVNCAPLVVASRRRGIAKQGEPLMRSIGQWSWRGFGISIERTANRTNAASNPS